MVNNNNSVHNKLEEVKVLSRTIARVLSRIAVRLVNRIAVKSL